MKEVKAIIDPGFLFHVMEALHALPHFPGATISDAQGQGRGRGQGGKHVSYGDALSFKKKVKVEIFCSDALADHCVRAIQSSAHSGASGHGIIVVSDLPRVVRISSGEEQEEAV